MRSLWIIFSLRWMSSDSVRWSISIFIASTHSEQFVLYPVFPCVSVVKIFYHRARRDALGKSTPEKIADGLLHDRTADLGDGSGQRDILGADLNAILRVPAFLDPAIAHQSREAFALQRFARGMRVEQPHLRNGGRAYESCVFVELRAGLHAAATRDAAGNGIGLLLLFRGHARPGAEVVRAVDRNPRFDGFAVFAEHAAVGGQIANDVRLGERS